MSRKKITQTILILTCLIFTATETYAQGAVSQEVFDSDLIPIGSVVSLTNSDIRKVELANTRNAEFLFGVVTLEGSTLAEIGTENEGQQVVNSGDVSVVVSTINGPISNGDILGVSSISGVAARADRRVSTTILGVASADFSADSPNARIVSSTDEDSGEVRDVVIGTIPVRLSINEFFTETTEDAQIVSFGERLVGRPVTQLQAVAASALVLTSIIVGGIIMGHAIRGGFISIGRNPLSGNAVFNGIYYVTIVSISVIVGGIVAGYVVLLL